MKKIAMLGTGLIGTFYTMSLHGLRSRDKVVNVYSRSEERASKFALDNNIPKWSTNMELFKQFTNITQGVRRLGAAAIDLCHVATGKVDSYWEFDIKPWDTTAGVLIVQEAGGIITKMDGTKYSIHHPQILATNGKIHSKMLKVTKPVIDTLKQQNINL